MIEFDVDMGYLLEEEELDRAKVLRQGDWSDGADDAALMEQAADTIDAIVTALEDVLRNAGDTVWVGKAETLVDRMVALGIYGHEVYEGARLWEVDA